MKPRKSVWFALPYAKRSLDVSWWDGQEKEGKWQASKVSIRLKRDGEDGSDAVYLYAADALKLANALQHYAFEALESDGVKRREQRKFGTPKTVVSAAGAEPLDGARSEEVTLPLPA